jgi:Tetratricopeptide repeat
VTLPVTAPGCSVAVTCVSEFTVKVALALPMVTPLVCFRLMPVIVTCVPTGPLLGLKLEIVGMILNFCGVLRLPPGSKIGDTLVKMGRLREADATYAKALEIANPTLSLEHKDFPSLYGAADAYAGLGDVAAAKPARLGILLCDHSNTEKRVRLMRRAWTFGNRFRIRRESVGMDISPGILTRSRCVWGSLPR